MLSHTPRPDLVIVTVNGHETKAVHDAFHAATGAESVPVPRDDRLYHNLGAINGTTVYHAVSEMGSGGPGAMQQAVDKAIRALEPGAVLAVGVAFGVSEVDQAIGDILLSKQLQLYDLQRVGGDIVLRGDKPHATPRLVNHFDTFGQIRWKGAKVRPGLILSGEKLIDDRDYRDQLLKLQVEAVGGEMEGAGLYVSSADHKVDWIVIKAICDWADGNKKKNKTQRQKKAAKNAAEFVVESLKYAALKHPGAPAPADRSPAGNSSPADAGQEAAAPGAPRGRVGTADYSGKVVTSKQQEPLYTNLLKVAKLPDRIYIADTEHRFPATVWSALQAAGGDIGPEWLLASKRLFSFRDLRSAPWNTVCDTRTVRVCETSEWAETDDHDRSRDFVRLLNLALGALARTLDLCHHRRLDCYYFPATPDLKPRTLAYHSLQQDTSRDVFAGYPKTNKPDEVSHFRHAAFRGAFQRYGGDWHLQIEPTYVYTRDGHKPSRYHSELLSGIKRFDRNAAVIGQIAMWADYLTPDAGLFAEPYPHLRFGKLARFEVNRTIDDGAWLSHDDTAPEQEDSETGRSLFDAP